MISFRMVRNPRGMGAVALAGVVGALASCSAQGHQLATTDPSATAAISSAAAPSPSAKRWLVSGEVQVAARADAGASEVKPGPKGPPTVTPLPEASPLVAELRSRLPSPLPLNYANRIGNATYVSFGQHGAQTITFVFTTLERPLAPVPISEVEFQRHHRQQADGTELFVDDRRPQKRVATIATNQAGRAVTVAAETGASGQPPLLRGEETEQLSQQLLNLNLPAS